MYPRVVVCSVCRQPQLERQVVPWTEELRVERGRSSFRLGISCYVRQALYWLLQTPTILGISNHVWLIRPVS